MIDAKMKAYIEEQMKVLVVNAEAEFRSRTDDMFEKKSRRIKHLEAQVEQLQKELSDQQDRYFEQKNAELDRKKKELADEATISELKRQAMHVVVSARLTGALDALMSVTDEREYHLQEWFTPKVVEMVQEHYKDEYTVKYSQESSTDECRSIIVLAEIKEKS